MPIYEDLRGKVVLLTGGANGIGAAAVRALHEQAAQVYFCDVDVKAGKRLAAELGESVFFSKVDLRQEKLVQSWVQSVGKSRGQIDVLINNAAADPRIALEAMSAKSWDDLFALNLRAYFLTSQAAVPYMRRGGESIVNLASIVFHQGPARLSAYVATKSGIIGLTRSLARELGPRRIRVNVVSPGWVMTERQVREYVTPDAKKTILRSQCIPDLLQADELAQVILFLASDASTALTGQELLADRGWYHS